MALRTLFHRAVSFPLIVYRFKVEANRGELSSNFLLQHFLIYLLANLCLHPIQLTRNEVPDDFIYQWEIEIFKLLHLKNIYKGFEILHFKHQANIVFMKM